MADALAGLKDDLPPFPTEEARRIVEASIGEPVDTVFESFSDSVAAASIAQVHKAVLHAPEGRETVAVKVLRPGVRRRFARDLRTFYAGARFVEQNAPETRRLRPVAVVEILQRSVLAGDGSAGSRPPPIRRWRRTSPPRSTSACPRSNWELTGRDVLVTEWVEGTRLGDRAAIVAAGHDPQRHRRRRRAALPAPCAARRLLPRRHARGEPLRRPRRAARRRRSRHHGTHRPEGAALPRRDPLRLHPPRLSAHRGGAYRGGLRAARRIRRRISRRRCAPSASRSTGTARARSRWRSCSACSSR